jgi:hypothetical protein
MAFPCLAEYQDILESRLRSELNHIIFLNFGYVFLTDSGEQRLPYESNERYEERLKALVPLSRSRSSYTRSVANVGLRRVRPAGMLPSAPILPFMLHSETLQSTIGPGVDGWR